MSEQLTNNFIEALGKLEAENDLETIVTLFAGDAAIGNVVSTETFSGTDGARKFWENYRGTFGEVESSFKNKIISENTTALEWTTNGTISDGGEEFNYEGVSILEVEDDKIKRFFAYFDSAKLGKQITENK